MSQTYISDGELWIVPDMEDLPKYAGKVGRIYQGNRFIEEDIVHAAYDPSTSGDSNYGLVLLHYKWWVSQCTDRYFVCFREGGERTSNKGRAKCWKCNCPTEKKRDFGDMSIREFCPRCKV
jgi:hypothetical protein